MDNELPFRIIFFAMWLVYLAYITSRSYYTSETRQSIRRFSIRRHLMEALSREGRLRIIARGVLTPFWVSGFMLYAIYPDWMAWFTMPLPVWTRWAGLAVSILALLFAIWAYHALGMMWTPPKLWLRKEHKLVTTGPYRWIRHPIYAAGFAVMISLAITSANWLIMLPMIAGVVLIYAQIGREEALLLERFGEEYRAYMKRTGRFFP